MQFDTIVLRLTIRELRIFQAITHPVDRTRDISSNTDLIIYSIFQWGAILVSSYQALCAIGFCLAEMHEEDNMDYKVLAFILQAARDCAIRAKDVMDAVTEVNHPPRPKLRINWSIIAMAMGYYPRVGQPCSGYHELFFNGLLYVLFGVVGNTNKDLFRNTRFFENFCSCMNVTGN